MKKLSNRWMQPCAVVLFSALLSCYPRFSAERPGGEPLVIVRTTAVGFHHVPGSVVVGTLGQTIEACLAGEGQVQSIALWDRPKSKFTPYESELPCKTLDFLEASEISKLLHLDNGIYPWDRPHLGRKVDVGRSFVRGSESFLIAIDMDREHIQLIHGSWGNREGAETEHVYIVTDSGFQQVSLHTKLVELEPFSDF